MPVAEIVPSPVQNVMVAHRVSARSKLRDSDVSFDDLAAEFHAVAQQLRLDSADLAKSTGALVDSGKCR